MLFRLVIGWHLSNNAQFQCVKFFQCTIKQCWHIQNLYCQYNDVSSHCHIGNVFSWIQGNLGWNANASDIVVLMLKYSLLPFM